MDNIVFIAEYPDDNTIKDGMIQRIKSIDDLFINFKRIYLNISFKENYNSKKTIINNNITVLHLNYFTDKTLILKIIKKNKNIYIHSIYNYIKIRKFLTSFNYAVLDLHGAVPEELHYNNKLLKCLVYKNVEKQAFSNVNLYVYVSEQMKNHFENKYEHIKNGLIYPIFPNYLNNEQERKELDKKKNLRNSLGYDEDDVIFIYSGNTQKWQNIDLMLQSISSLKNNKYKFILLTKDIDKLTKKVNKYKINQENVLVDSVQPQELSKYYNIANYGFVLRDEHLLNQVACPTKLVEYMFYGIVPIVKSKNIGDFYNYGYEHIIVSEISDSLKPVKSKLNQEIIDKVYKKFNGTIIAELFNIM